MTSPEQSARKMIVLCSAVIVIFLGWAHFTSLDLVTRGQGRVIPVGQNVILQTPYSGKVLEFAVAAGDLVTSGQLIAVIDPVAAQGALAEAEKRLRALSTRLARLDAEMEGRVFDLSSVETDDPIEQQLIEAEKALSNARRANLQAQIAALGETRSRQLRELDGADAELSGLLSQITLQETEEKQILPLVDIGALGIAEKFRIERARNETETQVKVLTEKKSALQFAIQQTEAEITAARAVQQNTILDDRVKAMSEFAELSQRLPTLRQRVTDAVITSPVDGTVNQVFFSSVGAVVAEGATLVEIVPSNADLRIQALISPSDIANIEPDQTVRISFTAFDAAKYGSLIGKVIRVSADATQQGDTQERMYVVDSSIETSFADENGTSVQIKPGMVVQVDIVRGQRTILEYFWNPVVKIKDSALRE